MFLLATDCREERFRYASESIPIPTDSGAGVGLASCHGDPMGGESVATDSLHRYHHVWYLQSGEATFTVTALW